MNLKFPWMETKTGNYQLVGDDVFVWVHQIEDQSRVTGVQWGFVLFIMTTSDAGQTVKEAGHATNLCAMFAAEEALIDHDVAHHVLLSPGVGPPLA